MVALKSPAGTSVEVDSGLAKTLTRQGWVEVKPVKAEPAPKKQEPRKSGK